MRNFQDEFKKIFNLLNELLSNYAFVIYQTNAKDRKLIQMACYEKKEIIEKALDKLDQVYNIILTFDEFSGVPSDLVLKKIRQVLEIEK